MTEIITLFDTNFQLCVVCFFVHSTPIISIIASGQFFDEDHIKPVISDIELFILLVYGLVEPMGQTIFLFILAEILCPVFIPLVKFTLNEEAAANKSFNFY